MLGFPKSRLSVLNKLSLLLVAPIVRQHLLGHTASGHSSVVDQIQQRTSRRQYHINYEHYIEKFIIHQNAVYNEHRRRYRDKFRKRYNIFLCGDLLSLAFLFRERRLDHLSFFSVFS